MAGAATRTVLIVDDSEVVRRVLKVYLLLAHIDWIEAEDATRALQLLRLVPVDVVVADVHMPGVDGLEMVRRLRASERPALRRVPVILLSADEGADLEQLALAAGADRFVRKPISGEELAALLDACLSGARP